MKPLTASLEEAQRMFDRVAPSSGFWQDAARELNGWTSGFYEEAILGRLKQETAVMARTTVTAKSVTTLKVKPRVLRQLRTELAAYADLKAQQDAIQEAMDAHKAAVGALRDEIGETSIEIDGFKVTEVRGVSNRLDPKKLLAQGVTLAQIAEATVSKPKRPYEKITLPGAKDSGDDE